MGGNADFCDFAADYPQNIVPDPRFQGTSLIKGKIFNSGSLDSSVNDVDVTKRFNFGERKERACKVRRDIIYPQKGRNSQGYYLFIVNQETFRQAVEVEQCLDEGSECLTDSDAPSSGTTVCRQEYATHRLYATDGNGEQVYDSFSLPSACLCHFRDNFGLKSGFGGSGIKSSSGPGSQLPICRAGIQLNLPSGNVQAAQGARPPPILSQNFRDPSSSSSVIGGGRTQSNRRPRPAQPPQSLSQNFREPTNSGCPKAEANTRQFNINEDQLCSSRKKVIFPQKALNSQNKWMFVVNVGNFTQSVEVDECQGFGFGGDDDDDFGSCLYSGSQGNDPGSTSCRQLYREHRLLALNGANNLEVDSFKLPSVCACYTASNPFPEFRIARPRQG